MDENFNELECLVSLLDGVESIRNDLGKLSDAILEVMHAKLEELIKKLNGKLEMVVIKLHALLLTIVWVGALESQRRLRKKEQPSGRQQMQS